jgi:hypothetical protein
MGAGAYGVHQLRYVISPEDAAALRAHAYLAPVGTIVVGLLLFALAAALARIARGAVDEAPRFRRLWAGTSGALLAVYCVQETIEQLLTSADRNGALANGGWIAVPLALAVGLAIALLMRGTVAASETAARERGFASVRAVPLPPFLTLSMPWWPRRSRAAARRQAPRGPPLASA